MKPYDIVTSCTPAYLPGLETLRNSINIEFPEAQLSCFYYSQGKDVELPEGITYIREAPMPGPIYQEGEIFRLGAVVGPDMYARLLVPKYFNDRAFYVDADCILLDSVKELWELDLQEYASACVFRPDIGWSGGNMHDDMGSGTLLFDTDKWRKEKITERCFELMKDAIEKENPPSWHLNVESVLSWMHQGKFYHLDPEYQFLAYYEGLHNQIKIIHYASHHKPWPMYKGDESVANYRELWRAYRDMDLNKIQHLKNSLPNKKEFFKPTRRDDIVFE